MADDKRFERAFHVSPNSMSLTTLKDGRFIDVNAAMSRVTGYSREETIGRTATEMGIWVNPEVARAAIVAGLAANGVVHDQEVLMRLKGGEERIFLMGAAVIEDPVEPLMMAGFQDVTERRLFEETLRDSESRHRKFIEDLPLGVVITQKGIIKFTNVALQKLMGFSAEELNGKPFQPFIVEEDRSWLTELHQRRMSGESVSAAYECRFITKSNEVRLWRLETHTVNWDGPAAMALVSDNTDAMRAEAELRLAASVFAQASEAIVISNADSQIIAVNDSFERLTGYTAEDVLGRNPNLLISTQHDADFYAGQWRALDEHGQWQGELWNLRKDGSLYAVRESISRIVDAKGAVSHYVTLFSDITDAKLQQQQLENLAHYDFLTSLPNRVLLADRLQQAMIEHQLQGQTLAVIYLDLDGFKPINDRYGHNIGDQLLIALAQRMQGALREGDTLSRIGGDEFVAVLTNLEHQQDCKPILDRLLLAAAESVSVDDLVLGVSASIGVTFYPQDNSEADLLLRHADQAMYQAKQMGKNRYHLFDVAQDVAVTIRHESAGHFRRALDNGELRLYYQPKVNMKTGELIGLEALIRWQHPERGLLPPAAFLAAIDGHPISMELDEWVIDAALAQIRRWRAAGLDISVSVNIGAGQLQRGDFVTRLSDLLSSYPEVNPANLELEVLESSALEDMVQVIEVMNACIALGVSFALDDFGTGYSSLTYLRRLPAKILKIDLSFVRAMLDDPDDLAIVEGVIGLANAFRRQVIAEGVETVAHGTQLLAMGCVFAQGYGVAQPMPASEIPKWLDCWRPDPIWTV